MELGVLCKGMSIHRKKAFLCGASEVIGCFNVKMNISFLATGYQKFIDVDDECKLCTFYEKHMATELTADSLGKE